MIGALRMPSCLTARQPQSLRFGNRTTLPETYTDPITQAHVPLGRAKDMLEPALQQGWLNPLAIKNIFEFGPGPGNSTLPLSLAFPESQIDAVDRSLSLARSYCHWKRPNVRFHEADGFKALKAWSQQFDLIAAFQLGPDEHYHPNGFSAQFLEAAKTALKPGGKAIVTSDLDTMSTFLEAFAAFKARNPTATIQQYGAETNIFKAGHPPCCEMCVISF